MSEKEEDTVQSELYYESGCQRVSLSQAMARESMYLENYWSIACDICSEHFHVPQELIAKDPHKPTLYDKKNARLLDAQLRRLLNHRLKHVQQDLEKLNTREVTIQ